MGCDGNGLLEGGAAWAPPYSPRSRACCSGSWRSSAALPARSTQAQARFIDQQGGPAPSGRGRSPASAARRPRDCRPAAGKRCRSVSRPPQALHPDRRTQRPRPNEPPGQHRWSDEGAERPGAAPTMHCAPDGNGLCTAATRISDGVQAVWTVGDSDAGPPKFTVRRALWFLIMSAYGRCCMHASLFMGLWMSPVRQVSCKEIDKSLL